MVREDLAVGQQAAQIVHAVIEYCDTFDFQDWKQRSNHVVVLSIQNEDKLVALQQQAKERGIAVVGFREPDWNSELTALVLEPGQPSRKLCATLCLLGS